MVTIWRTMFTATCSKSPAKPEARSRSPVQHSLSMDRPPGLPSAARRHHVPHRPPH